LIWLVIGGVINYMDRASLSIAAPEMIRELGLTRTKIGLLGTVFAWTYAVMQLPAGWLIDRFGAKRAYAIGMIWWSVATWLTGVVGSLAGLLVMRVLLAVGEAPCWPTSAKITAAWFPDKERGFATGIWDSSSKWGPAIAPVALVALMVAFGWRSLFHVTGLVGVLFALLFLWLYRSPAHSRGLSAPERAYIEAGGGGREDVPGAARLRWTSLFRHRSIWGMILGYFCAIWLWNLFLTFLPLYLRDRFHVTLTQMGVYASIPWIGGAMGEIVVGYLTARLVDRGVAGPMATKRLMIVLCSVGAGLATVMLPFATSLVMTVTLMTIGLAFVAAVIGAAWALAADVAPTPMVASVSSIQNFGGYFGGAFSPVVAGFLVDRTGSYAIAFVSGGLLAGCAAFFYWFMVREPIPESGAAGANPAGAAGH
jgi:sugar phosphate permease